MMKQFHIRCGFCLILLALTLRAVSDAQSPGMSIPPLPSGEHREAKIVDKNPEKPDLPPAFAIPVGPMGFTAPGPVYLLRRESLVSLDFLDENRLLFSFHVAGLLQRDAGDDAESKERQIRAVVVTLPDGKIQSEALWRVPDRGRYLWMLKDGHFLLRTQDGVDQGDAALKTTPYLRFPGRLLWLEMDPTQHFVITNSLEPGAAAPDPGAVKTADAAAGTISADAQPGMKASLVVRTLQRESGEVMRMSRVPWTSQTKNWAMNDDGYLTKSRDQDGRWRLKLRFFVGGGRVLGHVDSRCPPEYSFVSEKELLLTVCDPAGNWELLAMSTSGRSLWEVRNSSNGIWPLLRLASDGSRVARETLLLKRPVARYKRLLSAEDVQGQMVRVFDAATGKVVLEAPVSPTLDGGGNVAISPSGRRVAVLNAGAIQVFELAAAAPLTTLSAITPGKQPIPQP